MDEPHWSEFKVRQDCSGSWVVMNRRVKRNTPRRWLHCDGSIGDIADPSEHTFPTREAAEVALEVYRRKQEGEPPFRVGDVVERTEENGSEHRLGMVLTAQAIQSPFVIGDTGNWHHFSFLRLITPVPRDETTKGDGMPKTITVELTPEELELATALSNVAHTPTLKSAFKEGGYPGAHTLNHDNVQLWSKLKSLCTKSGIEWRYPAPKGPDTLGTWEVTYDPAHSCVIIGCRRFTFDELVDMPSILEAIEQTRKINGLSAASRMVTCLSCKICITANDDGEFTVDDSGDAFLIDLGRLNEIVEYVNTHLRKKVA